jgi:hypothetical protein
MPSLRVGLVAAALSWPCLSSGQCAEWVTIGTDVSAFHEDVFRGQKLKIEESVVVDIEMFVELIGLPNVAKINSLRLQIRRSIGLKNGLAYYGQGYRTIVFDPDWAASQTAEFYLVLGHEAGHLFCGHENRPQSPEMELEADRFGGASIKRFENYHNRSFFESVLAVAATKYPEKGSALYPPRASRLQALKEGYEHGSPCGNLAPVVQGGFSRGVR